MSNHDEPLAIIDQENPPPSNDQEETNQTTSKHTDSSSQTKSDCASQTNYGNGNGNVKDEAKPKQENNIHNNNTKRKRGPKPRSKRNRKKAKGGGVAVAISEKGDDENLAEKNAEVKVDILPLFHDNPARRERVRVVKPYFFTFATFVKARWVGKTVLDVYFNEFGSYPKSYYELAIQSGRILVNSKRVKTDFVLKGGYELSHTVHRHEPAIAVSDAPYNQNTLSSNSSDSTSSIVAPQNDASSRKSNIIPIVYEDDRMIVVDKPSTVPIHPCGGYNYNSLFHILSENDNVQKKLYTVHRLDRLTSGVVICAKTSEVAKQLGQCIMDRSCKKVYLARVKGKFPLNASTISSLKNLTTKDGKPPSISYGEIIIKSEGDSASTNTNSDTSKIEISNDRESKEDTAQAALGYWITGSKDNGKAHEGMANMKLEDIFSNCTENNKIDSTHLLQKEKLATPRLTLHLACPCRVSSPKIGICEAGVFPPSTPNVKPAQTSFSSLLYDPTSDTTIVLCQPVTGRTHQIRIHLQYLGHPIANDPNYGGELWYADDEGQKACKCAEERMVEMDRNSGQSQSKDDGGDLDAGKSNCKPKGAISTDIPATEMEIKNAEEAAAASFKNESEDDENMESSHEYMKKSCVWCRRSAGEEREHERVVLEFMVRSPGIWLHALKYF